ncbi:MAG: NAD(+) synthase [Eubacteriales bacterium]
MNFGFVKGSAASPRVQLAQPLCNAKTAKDTLLNAEADGVQILVFPELFLTGYTCGDLFSQQQLLDSCEEAFIWLLAQTVNCGVAGVIGLPVHAEGRLYNCAAVIRNGRILGVVPKMYIPNAREYYEKRWFSPGHNAREETITLAGQTVPFGRLLFNLGNGVVLGVEICEDLWVAVPPSCSLTLLGANIIANPSASNELAGKNEYRRNLVLQQSARCMCGYIYASAGEGESSTDIVFAGNTFIAEDGILLAEGKRFSSSSVSTCIDCGNLALERRYSSFSDNAHYMDIPSYTTVEGGMNSFQLDTFNRNIDPHPFVPKNESKREERCQEIISIQAAGLARRLEYTGQQKAVVGISGGLDSTLALLVTAEAFRRLGLPMEGILGITMPGFGTSEGTLKNALELMEKLHVTVRQIDIRPACMQHFSDIGQDPAVHDVTYENTQARERTQILFDIANKEKALLIGTGDLSELALGWCTYNGDHMSMYGVNVSIPKTLVKYLIQHFLQKGGDTSAALQGILNTPISPELLPPDENGIQKTESAIGPYELHDFFLYHTIRFGVTPKKLLFMARRAFTGAYSDQEILDWLRVFYKRFFTSQFKRSCLPDGPKVGSASLSPRGDWRMPSDASPQEWLMDLE